MIYEIRGVKIYVEGEFDPHKPEKPPLIFLHGFTLSSQEWIPLFEHFTNNFQPLAIDIIGHGRSSSPPDESKYSFGYFTTVVTDLLNDLDIRSAHWAGYSLGSRILLYFATKTPQYITSMILEGTTPGIENPDERRQRKKQDENLARFIEKNPTEKFVERWTQHPIFASQKNLSEEKLEYMRSIRLRNSSRGLAKNLRQMGRGTMPSLWHNLNEMEMPIFLLTGEHDSKHIKYAEKMRERLPNCEWKIIRNAGHNIHFERPEKFVDITLEFLKRDQYE
jgi:2-succinyl-6-hydroxy-2,4-cyclohexadiene-1-carboxylate synthase